jgi:hypothetical protein
MVTLRRIALSRQTSAAACLPGWKSSCSGHTTALMPTMQLWPLIVALTLRTSWPRAGTLSISTKRPVSNSWRIQSILLIQMALGSGMFLIVVGMAFWGSVCASKPKAGELSQWRQTADSLTGIFREPVRWRARQPASAVRPLPHSRTTAPKPWATTTTLTMRRPPQRVAVANAGALCRHVNGRHRQSL